MMRMVRRRGVGNLHRREVSGRQEGRAGPKMLPIGKIQAGEGGTTGRMVRTGGCVGAGEERSRGDGGDRWGQGASLDGETAGGEASLPAAEGRREETGRGHGDEVGLRAGTDYRYVPRV